MDNDFVVVTGYDTERSFVEDRVTAVRGLLKRMRAVAKLVVLFNDMPKNLVALSEHKQYSWCSGGETRILIIVVMTV